MGTVFVVPLIGSPLIASLLATGQYPAFRSLRRRLGIEASTCACVGMEVDALPSGAGTAALLVLLASRLGLPVSTTHVSCGALFGIGLITRQARWGTIGQILLAWVITLPVAAALAAIVALSL